MIKLNILFLLLICNLAHAEWVEVDPSDSRLFNMFYDPASISKVGNMATILTLKNFKDSQNSVDPSRSYTFLSKTSIQEIDCSKNKYRHKEISMWSKPDGKGRLEQTHLYGPNTSWGKWVKTTSIESILVSKACRGA